MNFVLVGKGLWGKKLHNNLKKLGNVKKIVRTKDDYRNINLKNIDWVVIATPNKYHYSQVKYFLEKKINIFCEKPLALRYDLAKNLIKISKKNNTKLYIDDIEIFKKKKLKIKNKNFIIRNKFSDYDFKQTLFALAYHDFYILSKYLAQGKSKISILNIRNNLYHFIIKKEKFIFDFKYNLKKRPKHQINNTNFYSQKNYILKMFKEVFFMKVNFEENHDRALKASYLISKILKKK